MWRKLYQFGYSTNSNILLIQQGDNNTINQHQLDYIIKYFEKEADMKYGEDIRIISNSSINELYDYIDNNPSEKSFD